MEYNKNRLQTELNSLIGESIRNVFYYTEYDSYETFNQLSHEVVEIPLLGMLLEVSSKSFYNIVSYDYTPYYGLGGIRVFRDKLLKTPEGRPNQINGTFWNHFLNKKITYSTIIESFYWKLNKQISIPFGIKLVFNGEECYIMNLTVEGFIEKDGIYDLCRGGELVLFSNKSIFERHRLLEENVFYI